VVAVTNHTVTGAPLVSGNASYRPLSNPLTATDAGATATVSIAAFTMRVAGTDLSINSGSITALSFSTLYYIYYTDSDFNGGTVTYAATTTKENALAGADRFFVGSILTPADGTPDNIGNGDGGSGAQSGRAHVQYPSANAATAGGGFTNPTYAADNDLTTYATGTDSDTLNSSKGHQWYGYFVPPTDRYAQTQKGWIDLEIIKTGAGVISANLEYSVTGGVSWNAFINWPKSTTVARAKYNVGLGGASQVPGLRLRVTVDWVSGASTSVEARVYDQYLESVS